MNFRRLSSKVGQLGLWTKKISLPERFKRGSLKKWTDYWRNVGIDYREACKEIIKDSRERPLKASIYIAGICGIGYAINQNPNQQEFRNVLQGYLNESAMYGDTIRNKDVDNFYTHLIECFNHDLVRRINLGICSIIWIDNYSNSTGIFKSQCSYLKPRYLKFHERIADVGFLGTWWNIHRKVKCYDINEEEWSQPKTRQSDENR